MKLISVNVGLPREVDWQGKSVRTSIWKYPVEGLVRVGKLNLENDQQSDLSVHGGTDKAVYAYPSEHYSYWRQELPDMELPWGVFGENLSTEGFLEEEIQIGDRLRVGTAELIVTQPRMPCFKLGIRFGRHDMVKRFLRSGRTGFYLSVFREGQVEAGTAMEYIAREEHGITVRDIVALYTGHTENREILRRASELAALPEGWRDHFRKQHGKRDA
jgi:MOSC domain-containing protein YiiM